MNRIDNRFRKLRKVGKKAFIAYITSGDPDLAATARLITALEVAGVDIIELGIPFSDPLADGPVIQAASKRALDKGVKLKKIFAMVRGVRKATEIPLVFMTYYNPVLHYGLKRFCKECRISGVDGIIVPDLPCEEAGDLVRAARKEAVATIFLAAPTSTRKRLKVVAKNSRGFIYYVSLTGVTGARAKLPPEISANVRTIQSLTEKPVCVGFGVSNPKQARSIGRIADGVIVGSALIKVIEKNLKNRNIVANVSRFAKTLANSIHGV